MLLRLPIIQQWLSIRLFQAQTLQQVSLLLLLVCLIITTNQLTFCICPTRRHQTQTISLTEEHTLLLLWQMAITNILDCHQRQIYLLVSQSPQTLLVLLRDNNLGYHQYFSDQCLNFIYRHNWYCSGIFIDACCWWVHGIYCIHFIYC